MATHLEVSIITKSTDKDGTERKRWQRVGVAFPNRLGGMNVVLDGPIIVVPGVQELVIAEPKPKESSGL